MRRILLILALGFSTLTFIQPAQSAEICAALNVGIVADDKLTVTMKSIVITEKAGSNLLTITYNQLNATADKKLDEGSFKLFFADGSSEPQYGGFNFFFPNDTRDRSHTWEFLKTKEPLVIGYNTGFLSALTASRFIYGCGKEKKVAFSDFWTKLSENKSPTNSIIVTMIISILFALFNNEVILSVFTNCSLFVILISICICVLAIRWKERNDPSKQKANNYIMGNINNIPIVIILEIIVLVFLFFNILKNRFYLDK